MKTFKVKSTIKKDGVVYKPGDEIEVSDKEAIELGSALENNKAAEVEAKPKTDAEKKAKKEAAAQGKKVAAAKEKANDEVTDALAAAGKPDDVDPDAEDPDLNAPTTTNVSRETTQEDLDLDPTLVEQGVKIGDVREYPTVDTSATDDNAGDNL